MGAHTVCICAVHILSMQLDVYEATLSSIRSERGYTYSDIITVSPETLPNYEQKVAFLDNLLLPEFTWTVDSICCLLPLYVDTYILSD